MSAFFHGWRPKNPGSTYAAQNSSRAARGSRRTALWATMAGVGWFTRASVSQGGGGQEKGQRGCPGCPCLQDAAYFAAVLPNFLKNLSTRPPMSFTDFWVPV